MAFLGFGGLTGLALGGSLGAFASYTVCTEVNHELYGLQLNYGSRVGFQPSLDHNPNINIDFYNQQPTHLKVLKLSFLVFSGAVFGALIASLAGICLTLGNLSLALIWCTGGGIGGAAMGVLSEPSALSRCNQLYHRVFG